MKIAICGKMCSGKSTLANYIMRTFPGYQKYSFAEKVKELCVELFDMKKKDRPLLIDFANKNQFGFPYLNDETQEIARTYDAVCTPDFFGYNKNLELQYRGRLRELKNLIPVRSGESDLLKAMKQISETGKGPESQIPSAGCGIKWKK